MGVRGGNLEGSGNDLGEQCALGTRAKTEETGNISTSRASCRCMGGAFLGCVRLRRRLAS